MGGFSTRSAQNLRDVSILFDQLREGLLLLATEPVNQRGKNDSEGRNVEHRGSQYH